MAERAAVPAKQRSGTARWLMIGQDDRGRLLKIGILWADEREGILRAITAWPLA